MRRCALVLVLLLGCRSSAPKMAMQASMAAPESGPLISEVILPMEKAVRIEYPPGAENKMWRVLRATNISGPWEVFTPYCGAPANAGDLYVTNDAKGKVFFKMVTVTNAVFWIKP